jgi:hypothetical protein
MDGWRLEQLALGQALTPFTRISYQDVGLGSVGHGHPNPDDESQYLRRVGPEQRAERAEL